MASLICESTCQKEKAVIKYTDKTKGCIPVWEQGKLADHDSKFTTTQNSFGDVGSTFRKEEPQQMWVVFLGKSLMKMLLASLTKPIYQVLW